MKKTIKVAWGIDPYNSVKEIDVKTKDFIKKLQDIGDCTIDPIHVTSATNFIYTEYALPLPDDILPSITKSVYDYLEDFSDIKMADPKVIECSSSYRSSEVNSFANYVEKHDYDFVLLSAHGRSGLKRLMLGSFAENFIVKCKTPTFIINSETKSDYDITKAMAPVEIDKETSYFSSEIIKNERLDFINTLTFYHHICSKDFNPQAWIPNLYQAPDHNYMHYANKATDYAKEFLKELVDKNESTKTLNFQVSKEYESLDNIVTGQINKIEAGLLLIKTNTGPLDFIFFSGLTKEMIRKSNVPVLIFPRKYKK